MNFYSYCESTDIHTLDYSGRMTMKKGLLRLQQLEDYFKTLPNQKDSLKILIDAVDFTYDSEATHHDLAQKGRELFYEKLGYKSVYTAILNGLYNGSPSENERWFTGKDEAIKWLSTCELK